MRGVLLAAVAVASALASEPGFRFEANQGQAKPSVCYIARAPGASATFEESTIRFAGVTLRLAGESGGARWEAAEPLSSESSYFLGNDPVRWVRGVRHYGRLIRREAWPGIAAVFYGNGGRLEFDFVISPHADPGRIRLSWPGAQLRIGAAGELEAVSGESRVVVRKPVVYQTNGRTRSLIPGDFEANAATGEVRFRIGEYDPELPVTIDPTVESWTFLGGTGNDRITAVIPGLVAGVTTSPGLTAAGTTPKGTDIFVWDGQNYTVYGGSGDEEPTAAVRAANRGYLLAGWTSSRDFPLLGDRSVQRTYGGGARDGFFISSLSYPGAYSSYLGGTGDDAILAAAEDTSAQLMSPGSWYLTGVTNSPDFPVRAAIQPALGGGKDGFVARLSADGALVESTYFGGSGDDAVLAVTASARSCWLGGRTNSPDLRMVNPLQKQPGGGADGFLARIDESAAPTLAFSSYFGGSGDDEVRGLRIGRDGWIWGAGTTGSTDLPVTSGSPAYAGGESDVWAARFHPGGGVPSFVTYLGGSGRDEVSAIALDGNSELYLAGWTTSTDLRSVDALQATAGGGEDGFLARLDRDGVAQMLTYVGGGADDRLASVAVGPDQRVYAGGQSQSAVIPALEGTAPKQSASGQTDGLFLTLQQDGVYASDLVVGRNLSAQLEVLAVAGGQKLPVMVRSSNPSLVRVQGGAFGSATADIFGESYRVGITAGTMDGDAELIVSAPGLPARRVSVRVRPSYLVNPYTSEVVVPLDTTATAAVTLRLSTATVHPDSGEVIPQSPSPYSDGAVTWRSDHTEIVQVRDSSNLDAPFAATLRGVSEGTAAVTATDPRFAPMGEREIRIRVATQVAPALALKDTAVGRMMQTQLVMTAQNAPYPPGAAFAVRVTSEDPSRLLLSASPGTAGAESATVSFRNTNEGTAVWAQGRGDTGVVRVRIEVEGAPTVFANIVVVPGIMAIATPAQTWNAGWGPVAHDLSVTSATLDLWSTHTTFAVYADLPKVPAGFAIGVQIPSPESVNRFGVLSSDPSVATGATGMAFDLRLGTAYVLFGVALMKSGSTVLSLDAPGFDVSAPVTVTVRGRALPLLQTEITLGKDLETEVLFGTPSDFPRGVSVTVTSGDPSKVLVSRYQIDEGQRCEVPLDPARNDGFWISALASSGDVPLTLTAPGFETRILMVHLAPTSYRLTPSSVTATVGGVVGFEVIPTFPGMAIPRYALMVRAAVKPSLTLTSSDTGVVKVNTPNIVMQGYSGYVAATAVAPGVAELRLAAVSAAAVDPAGARLTATIVSARVAFGVSTMALGKDLQALLIDYGYPFTAQGATIRSLDPSRLLLTGDPRATGVAEIGARGPLWVQALADSGEAFLTVSVPGYDEARVRVLLFPTAIGFANDLMGLKSTVAPGTRVDLRLAPFAMDPASGNPVFVRDPQFRGGMDAFEVTIRSSDTAVGKAFSPVAFAGGMSETTTQFRADGKGKTTLSVDAPAGFADGGAPLWRDIEVSTPALTLHNIALGKDMQLYYNVGLSSPAQASGAITVTSEDPSRVLVSTDPKRVGQGSVTISLGSYAGVGFYVQALDSAGDVKLTATADGYEPATATVHLEPSYFSFTRGPFSAYASPLSYRGTGQVGVYLTHATDEYQSNRSLRPGAGPQTVPIESSNTAVVEIQGPVQLTEGSPYAAANLMAGDAGTATLTLGAPPGFALAPEGQRSVVVKVELRLFNLGGGYIGKDRIGSIGMFQPVTFSAAVRLVSTDPGRVLLSLDPHVAGTPEVSFQSDATKAIGVWAHALADNGTVRVTASATGFLDATVPIALHPSGYRFDAYDPVIPVGRSVTVKVVTNDTMPLRPGVAPAQLAIENSNPAVATASPVIFGPGDSSKDLTITGKSAGVTVLTIRDSGYPNSVSVIVTVTAN